MKQRQQQRQPKTSQAQQGGFFRSEQRATGPHWELILGCLSGDWSWAACGGLEVQRGAAADTETLKAARS